MMNLKSPTLLLDKEKCLANIRRMKAKADRHHLIFRPHFKTHQSAGVGEWFRQSGIDKITVSSVIMARYFVQQGWNDITIAFPVNPAEIEDIRNLAQNITLNVLVENFEGVSFLTKGHANNLGVFIKIDAGYHRTGVDVDDHKGIYKLIRRIDNASGLTFKGFIVHNGHTYHASGTEEILTIHDNSLDKFNDLRQFMKQQGRAAIYSIGDTPAISQTENFDGVDEIRPGNFVFYDVMQQNLGACRFQDIAVALACPVVAKHASRNELVIYGGAVHLSKDFIIDNGNKSFGRVAHLKEKGWSSPVEGTFLKSLSQEHGIIKASPQFFSKVEIGDFIGILPIHSCLTVDAMRRMVTPDDEIIRTYHG